MLVPLPTGIFSDYDLTTRAVIGALYNRLRLSSYNLTGGDETWYDDQEGRAYCVYTHDELARMIGVGERTIRRSLALLQADGLVWWRKATYKGANRYYVHDYIMQELRGQ